MKHLDLSGKKIIFFCPKTFGYDQEILSEMRRMGADVTFRSDKPIEHAWAKGFIRLYPRISWNYSDRYFFRWLEQCTPAQCDFIFIIRGEGLSPAFMRALRQKYPEARIILHLWDNIANLKKVEMKFPYVDDISSYDPLDCQQFSKFKFRPLFFLEKYLSRDVKHNDRRIFFVGTLHSDRSRVISMIKNSLPRNVDLDYWLFIRSRVEYSLRLIVDPHLRALDRSRLIFKPLSFENISMRVNKCSAVIDIEHPRNTGLTMRTFEMIAAGKKLITTNKSIIQHDFYDPKRICVIDRNNPSLPPDFLEEETPPLSDHFLAKYSLRRWILDILDVKQAFN